MGWYRAPTALKGNCSLQDERNSSQKTRDEIKRKSGAIIVKLKRLHSLIPSPSATAILRVLKAKLIPSINYAHLAYPGKLANVFEWSQIKAHKCMLGIAKRARAARLRAELGLPRQDLLCKKAAVLYYISTLRAPITTVKAANRYIFEEKDSPWSVYLKEAITDLGIVEASLLNSTIPFSAWKSVLKRELSIISLRLDLESLSKSSISLATNSSYRVGVAQPYLHDSLSQRTRSRILNLRLHTLPLADFNPKWVLQKHSNSNLCRLCNSFRESWSHLLCCCEILYTHRVRLLKRIFLTKGSRTTVDASNLCFTSSLNTMDLALFAKYAHLMVLELKHFIS